MSLRCMAFFSSAQSRKEAAPLAFGRDDFYDDRPLVFGVDEHQRLGKCGADR